MEGEGERERDRERGVNQREECSHDTNTCVQNHRKTYVYRGGSHDFKRGVCSKSP